MCVHNNHENPEGCELMSRDTHPTRGTRIHPKGLQSPLEGRPPHGETGTNKGSICRYNMLDSLLKASPLRARGEDHSTECVEGVFYEIRLSGILGRALRAVCRGNESVYTPLSPSRRPMEEPCRKPYPPAF
jgi:hypothetical protein